MVHDYRTSSIPESVKEICLVEDEADIRTFLVHVIELETPYHVAAVATGSEALRVAKEVRPQLFILDYSLPGMNGIELYDQLQTIEEVANTPTIMVSAQIPTHEIAKRQIIGIPKPFDLIVILNTIEALLA